MEPNESFFQFPFDEMTVTQVTQTRKLLITLWEEYDALQKEDKDIRKLMLIVGERYKEKSNDTIFQVIAIILNFFRPKQTEIKIPAEELAFYFIDYVNTFRRSSAIKFYPDLWTLLSERGNFNPKIRLIYDPLQKIIEKDNEYTQEMWKLLDSVNASRKDIEVFLADKSWRDLLSKEPKQILEKFLLREKKNLDGYWIIPHRKIFAHLMGLFLKKKNIEGDRQLAQEHFVVLMIMLFNLKILTYANAYDKDFSLLYEQCKKEFLS